MAASSDSRVPQLDRLSTSTTIASLPAELRVVILGYVAGLHLDTRGLPLPVSRLRDLCSLLRTTKAFLTACDRDYNFWARLWQAVLPAPMRSFLSMKRNITANSCREQFEALCAAHGTQSPRRVFCALMAEAPPSSPRTIRRTYWVSEGGDARFANDVSLVLHTTEEEFVVSALASAPSRPQMLVAPGAVVTGVPDALLKRIDFVHSMAALDRQRPVCLHWSVFTQSPANYPGLPQCRLIAVSLPASLCLAASEAPDHPLCKWSAQLSTPQRLKLRPNGPYHLHPSFANALAPQPFYAPSNAIGFYGVNSNLGKNIVMLVGIALMRTAMHAGLPPAPAGGAMSSCFLVLYVTACLSMELAVWNEREALRCATKCDQQRP